MQNQQVYVTEIITKKLGQQNLKKYVDQIDSKINYAKWKQNLVLCYNYIPLANIQQRIESQRKAIMKKNSQQENRMIALTNSENVLKQLEVFGEFQQKLKNKINQIELQIQKQNMNIYVLKEEAQDRRNILKQVLRQNKNMMRYIFPKQQQTPIKVKKSQSASKFSERSAMTKKRSQKKLPSLQKRQLSTRMSSQNSRVKDFKNDYEECLNSTIRYLRKMQGTQDVQQGIYLDIMPRKQKSHSLKFSLKSNICNILMDRYGHLKSKRKQDDDFFMNWDTFKELNWKQIMGIVLVKDRQASNIKRLLSS